MTGITIHRVILALLLCATSAGAASNDIVINEVHYDPPVQNVPAEFIELYNQGAEPVNVMAWTLTNAVTFTFPNLVIAPGEYVVVAQDPGAVAAEFGFAGALGPWLGKLDNAGERIVLRNGEGTRIDEVDYGVDFPWPTAAQGAGPSMELVHPLLDNDLGGSWRSASTGFNGPPATFLAPAQPGWSYRKGQTQPAADGAGRQWFDNGYDEGDDGQWIAGQTPVGFGDGDDATILTDMHNGYISVFLRREFTIAPGETIPSSLLLRAYFDDGCVAYINGQEVARFSLSAGAIPFPPPTGFASSHEAAWDESILGAAAAYLQPGTNTLAIQVINSKIGSSDISIDAELKTPPPSTALGMPSPGAPNSVFSPNAPPQVRQVEHIPVQPLPAEPVTITAKISDPQGVASATLHYQSVDPGSYIRLTDASYQTEWIDLTMRDDGTGDDAVAGDARFTATVPADLQVHRRLIRYRISTSDGSGASIRVPYNDDPQPNFAYFCYAGVPAWTAADRPGVTPAQTFGSELLESIPVYHLIARESDVNNCQFNSGFRNTRFKGTMVYDGEVYDHIEFNIRGQFSTYRTGKNKWHFRFNRGHHFQARDNFGKKFDGRWKNMKVNGGTAPWTYVNRGMAGVDECISYRLFELAGVPSSRTSHFHFRVIDDVAESSPSSQYEGDIWGLYFSVEVPDGRFLDDRNLPDGNVYKLESPLLQHNQGADEPTGPADVNALRGSMSTSRSEQWWRDNVDHLTYGRYKGVAEAVAHYDQRDGQQGYYYHNPETGRWVMMPWDLDTMFQLTHKYYTWDRFRHCIDPRYPTNFIDAKNQQREILDLLFNETAVDTVMAELVDVVNPAGQPLTWSDVDQFVWNYHPRTPGQFKGSYNVLTGSSDPAGVRYTRTLISADHEGQMDYMRTFMQPGGFGYDKLVAEVADAQIPATPTITYTGTAGYPVNGLAFQSTAFSDPGGAGTFAAVEWRVAEISDPAAPNYDPTNVPPYEVDAVWESGELVAFAADSPLVPSSEIRSGSTYRARARHMDSSDRWSHWSAPLEFTASLPDLMAYKNGLVVSEVMYKPSGGGLLEFVEIKNVGPVTLDLSDVRFTKGIDFDFAGSAVTSIDPDAYVLVVEDLAAFETQYGNALPVAGEFVPDKLSNGGEQLKLSFGAGTAIRDFVYDDELPWPTIPDTDGHSLVLIDPDSVPDHTVASNWRSSARAGGNPGASDAAAAFAGTAGADDDHDGLVALLEHGTGGDDADPGSTDYPQVSVEQLEVGSAIDDYLIIRIRRDLAVDDVVLSAEISADMINWESGPESVVLVEETANGDGTSTLTFRSAQPVGSAAQAYIRARAERD